MGWNAARVGVLVIGVIGFAAAAVRAVYSDNSSTLLVTSAVLVALALLGDTWTVLRGRLASGAEVELRREAIEKAAEAVEETGERVSAAADVATDAETRKLLEELHDQLAQRVQEFERVLTPVTPTPAAIARRLERAAERRTAADRGSAGVGFQLEHEALPGDKVRITLSAHGRSDFFPARVRCSETGGPDGRIANTEAVPIDHRAGGPFQRVSFVYPDEFTVGGRPEWTPRVFMWRWDPPVGSGRRITLQYSLDGSLAQPSEARRPG